MIVLRRSLLNRDILGVLLREIEREILRKHQEQCPR
jgi:hypothetical protein